MRVIGRAFVILLGLCVALAAGSMVLIAAMVLEPSFARIISYVAQSGLAAAFDAMFQAETPDEIMGVLFGLWSMMATLLAGPPTLIALIGEVARVGSFVWYGGATGLATAALPWILRGGIGTASPAEIRVTLGLFLVGAASGLAYWLVAGRSAGVRPGPISGPASPIP
jgi:hypothetical protein